MNPKLVLHLESAATSWFNVDIGGAVVPCPSCSVPQGRSFLGCGVDNVDKNQIDGKSDDVHSPISWTPHLQALDMCSNQAQVRIVERCVHHICEGPGKTVGSEHCNFVRFIIIHASHNLGWYHPNRILEVCQKTPPSDFTPSFRRLVRLNNLFAITS